MFQQPLILFVSFSAMTTDKVLDTAMSTYLNITCDCSVFPLKNKQASSFWSIDPVLSLIWLLRYFHLHPPCCCFNTRKGPFLKIINFWFLSFSSVFFSQVSYISPRPMCSLGKWNEAAFVMSWKSSSTYGKAVPHISCSTDSTEL